jgi:hypothetical protein
MGLGNGQSPDAIYLTYRRYAKQEIAIIFLRVDSKRFGVGESACFQLPMKEYYREFVSNRGATHSMEAALLGNALEEVAILRGKIEDQAASFETAIAGFVRPLPR